ncbi:MULTISPECIES: competence protein ComJ [Oligella]|nr:MULTISPECIES: competence protein ComJ [Oligella]OFV50243.1 hypothetical protein HMPREF3179_02930 [Oligella sp. HMSC09E12]SUA66317.1 Competence protein J (ComJ) [Oligella urethralis]
MNEISIDLYVSHRQIHFRSGPYDESFNDWTKDEIQQGAILGKSHVVFDPIASGDFDAVVNVRLAKGFTPSSDVHRVLKFPFIVVGDLYLSSPMAEHELKLDIAPGVYTGYFEVCEDSEQEELYFNIVLIPNNSTLPETAEFFIDDRFGGAKGKLLASRSV